MLPQLRLMRLLLLTPAEAEGDRARLCLLDVGVPLCSSLLDAFDVLGSPGAGDLFAAELLMGTSGGMSLGATGARNDPDLPLSLPGDERSFFSAADLPSSFFGELGLLPSPLLEELQRESLEAAPSLFFSMGGMMDLDGVESLPMLLHVCASRARGLFLASNCKTGTKQHN